MNSPVSRTAVCLVLIASLILASGCTSIVPTRKGETTPSPFATPVHSDGTPVPSGSVTPTASDTAPSPQPTPTASTTSAPTRSPVSTPTPAPVPTSGTSLHAFGNGFRIGDVHPFFDVSGNRWMMFFLANIGGSYVPRLLVSTDRLVWTQKAIQHTGESPSQTYYALGVLPFAGAFATYYGNGGTMEASSSANLLSWKNAPSYRIQNDLTTFSATSRDPYVFKDPDVGLYRCISSAYRANEGWGYGSGLDVSLALSTSTGNSLEGWQTVQKELIHFPEGMTGEPECPQMLRIGNRWYIIASMARRSSNFVGRLSYWIGDAGKGIDDVDWSSKTEHFLDGEDVCAAQIAYDGSKFRMWGWIPESYNGGTWGGHLSLPRIVSALPDGRLTASPDVAVIEKAEGETVGTLAAGNLSSGNSQLVETGVTRVSYTVTLSFTDSVQIRVGGAALQLEKTNGRLSILRVSDGRVFSSFDAGNGALDGEIEIKVIAEDNILEVFVANRWSLAGRCDVILKNDHAVGVASLVGTVNVLSGKVNRLKYLEELQQ